MTLVELDPPTRFAPNLGFGDARATLKIQPCRSVHRVRCPPMPTLASLERAQPRPGASSRACRQPFFREHLPALPAVRGDRMHARAALAFQGPLLGCERPSFFPSLSLTSCMSCRARVQVNNGTRPSGGALSDVWRTPNRVSAAPCSAHFLLPLHKRSRPFLPLPPCADGTLRARVFVSLSSCAPHR